MPMSPRLLRPRQTIHPEAADWANRVRANGSSVSGTTLVAVSKFCRAIDSAGIRSRFYRLNLFCGGAGSSDTTRLNAALVPLYRGPSVSNTFGNVTDTNAGGASAFIAADFTESAGLTAGLSSTKHLDTGLQTSALPAGVIDSGHLSAWHGAISAVDTDPYLIGANNGSADRAAIQVGVRSASAAVESCRYGKTTNVNASTGVTGARPAAFLLGQRTSAINLELWKNNSVVGTTATSTTGIAGIPHNFYVFSANNAGTRLGDQPGTTLRHYSIGDDMTPLQVGAFYDALSAFNASMGRV